MYEYRRPVRLDQCALGLSEQVGLLWTREDRLDQYRDHRGPRIEWSSNGHCGTTGFWSFCFPRFMNKGSSYPVSY